MNPDSFFRPLTIGGLSLENNVFLAPLAGVSDSPFRTVCRRCGAGMVTSEMISSKGVHYGSKGSVALAEHRPEEEPFAVQIFGNEPEIMAESARVFENAGAKLIDINMGCPVPKVVGNLEGSYLMTQPLLAGQIVKAVSEAVRIPVTVKMRRGFTPDRENAVEIAKICEENGAAAVTVHGRFRSEYYSGTSNPESIRRVKEAVSVPVIASGDIVSRETAERVFRQTGCDGIMIGRGALGSPWVFRDVLTGEKTRVTPDLIRETVKEQLSLAMEKNSEEFCVREMRKHIAWYLKGQRGAGALKERIFAAVTAKQVEEILSEL